MAGMAQRADDEFMRQMDDMMQSMEAVSRALALAVTLLFRAGLYEDVTTVEAVLLEHTPERYLTMLEEGS